MKIIKFYSENCPACKSIEASIQVLKNKYPNLEVEYIDIQKNPEYIKIYGIRSIPMLVKDGNKDYPCLIGNKSLVEIEKWLIS
jgi:thiol-disulfide isomerase/thioredoxin